jgi:hypothetical protein
MNQEEQDAVIGRVHREAQSNRSRLKALRKSAFDIGEQLEKAGQTLKQNPEALGFAGEEYSLNGTDPSVFVERSALDASAILRLVQDIRRTDKSLKNANEILGD